MWPMEQNSGSLRPAISHYCGRAGVWGLPKVQFHSWALPGGPPGPEATWDASFPSPGTCETILSPGMWHEEGMSGSTSPHRSHRQEAFSHPCPPLPGPQTYKPEALVALQWEPIHQIAGFVGTIRQDVAEMRLGDQRH